MSTVTPVRVTPVVEPGLALYRPGLEQYPVKGGGAIVVALGPGDELAVIDREGRQACELVVFDAKGNSDPAALGAGRGRAATGLQSILAGDGESARAVLAGLKRRELDAGSAQALALFSGDSRPGESAAFQAAKPLTCIVAAPGADMAVDAQDPPTDLWVKIKRANGAGPTEALLPEPLAEPRFEQRVSRCTAEAYEVKAGEFIQIIDVSGRECSDFLAFSAGQLDAGVERGLDATTTRTLMAAAYPGPGLHSKFLDQDMQPA